MLIETGKRFRLARRRDSSGQLFAALFLTSFVALFFYSKPLFCLLRRLFWSSAFIRGRRVGRGDVAFLPLEKTLSEHVLGRSVAAIAVTSRA